MDLLAAHPGDKDCKTSDPLSSTWPHLNSDVDLEKGEY